jgi:hypothetical protein
MFLLSLTATCQVCTVSLKAGLSTYNGFASGALHAPNGETAEPHAGIMGAASHSAAAVIGRLVFELEADGEDEGEDELDERLGIAKELCVGGLIVEIDGAGAVLAWCFGGLCHVSSPVGWRLVRMGHGAGSVLEDQVDCERIGVSPLNPLECERTG